MSSQLAGAPLPREHGAWSLLLLPFLAATLLAGPSTWLLFPALGLICAGFLLREPLTVLARQFWIWRVPNPQTVPASRWLAIELACAAACLAMLWHYRPAPTLAALVTVAAGLTLAAVWVTLHNRQRSAAFQIVSAAGLGSTALLAAFVVTGGLPAWAWQLWIVLTIHGAVSILTVHQRLAVRAGRALPTHAILPPLAAAFATLALPTLAAPILFSTLANAFEITRLHQPSVVREPLRKVGLRALAVSVVHAGLALAALWSKA